MGISPDTDCAISEVSSDGSGSRSPFAAPRDLVLLVEDDACVAKLMECILEAMAVRVVRATSGGEAERMLREKSAEIALAVVDCGLPDIDGRALCRRLRRILPWLPVLLTSGCDTVSEAVASDDRTVFLPKPFFPAQVRRQIRSLLAPAG